MTDTEYIVIRPAADLPTGCWPEGQEELLLQRAAIPGHIPGGYRGVAMPTGRFERCGPVLAEVYELGPESSPVEAEGTNP
jgi:hypothetical protein